MYIIIPTWLFCLTGRIQTASVGFLTATSTWSYPSDSRLRIR